MKSLRVQIAAVAAAMLGACSGDPIDKIDEAEPATGDRLLEYSRSIAERGGVGHYASLVQRFCWNAFAARCPEETKGRLEESGLSWGGTGVDLAYAFVRWIADEQDGRPDLNSSDEDYLRAAYRVALGREPDQGGARSNIAFIKDGGGRKLMLRSLLESPEFRNLRSPESQAPLKEGG